MASRENTLEINDFNNQLLDLDQGFNEDDAIDDDLLLTKTEGTLKFGSHVCSSQRSVGGNN